MILRGLLECEQKGKLSGHFFMTFQVKKEGINYDVIMISLIKGSTAYPDQVFFTVNFCFGCRLKLPRLSVY